MKICSGVQGRFHDQIVFQNDSDDLINGVTCPLCEEIEQKWNALDKIEMLEDELQKCAESHAALPEVENDPA